MPRSRLRSGNGALTSGALALALACGAGAPVDAQTSFIPYWGKNRVKYDKFDWHIYTTDHFEIYYYPELEEHLERIAGYAESAYQEISAKLRHDLAFAVPLICFKTHSEFEQQNIFPTDVPEGVGAFAEPQRNRIVLPIDEGPDGLYRLITHELTHIFEFDIIPRGLIRRDVPLWVDEGLADYLAGVWRPLDLMQVRDVAVSETVPSMTEFESYGGFASGRVVYNLGHAAFEFIEERWGDDGIRRFLFALRRTAVGGGGGDVYEETFDLSAEEFDDAFEKYLDERFEPFREKERPADYGRNLAPDPLRSRYPALISIEASPSGEVIAAVAANRRDRELDIVLVSSRTGEIIRNLTEGFDQDFGFRYVVTLGLRFNTVPWMSWAPDGDRLAYFVRRNKHKALVIQNVVTREIEQIIDLDMVDEPESPDFSPDGRSVVFSALRRAVGDVYRLDLETREVTNLTEDDLADYAPVYSPDGGGVLHLKRVSGNNKLFRLDLATGERTQLTFGTHDEGGAQFIDDRTIVFSSTAVDPGRPIEPDVARDGEIFNVWTLDVENGELRQYTDTATGNVNPIVLAAEDDGEPDRIAFITYYKSEYGLHTIERDEPVHTASTEDFGGPGPVIDFQAPLTHALIGDNARRKGAFENLYLEGRPPITVGMTSNGDFLGGTQITFTDVLGDQQFSMLAYSVSTYRTLGFSYANLAGRLQFALQGYTQDQFFYGVLPGFAFDPGFGFLSRDDAIAVRSVRGGSAFAIYPFDRFRRLELSAGLFSYKETFDNEFLQAQSQAFQLRNFGSVLFRDGAFMPLGINYVQETTVFREFGPIAGNTFRVSYEYAPPLGGLLSRQTVDVDARYYLRIAETGVLALRARGFRSWGDFPDFFYFGGNSEMRGYDYLEFLGQRTFFGNAELRFPLVNAMATPIGVLGGIRGTFFFNFGMAGFNDLPFDPWDSGGAFVRPVTGYVSNPDTGQAREVFGAPVAIDGFRLVNARASYGVSLATLIIGIPIHFDWSWRTLFNRAWEDVVFAASGGSEKFRDVRTSIWIGYDF